MYYDHTISVRAAPLVVYDIVAEPQEYAPPKVVPVLVKETPGPTRTGTQWREAVRLGPMLRLKTHSVAIACDPPRRLTLDWRGPLMHGQLTYTLERNKVGTRFRQQETMLPEGPLRLVGGLIGRVLARRLTARMEDIRKLAESSATDTASPDDLKPSDSPGTG